MINATIEGQKMVFANEAQLIAFQTGPARKKSESCGRVRRIRKRENALRFHFKLIRMGRESSWKHIEDIYQDAPELTERVAKEAGVTELKIEKCNGEEVR